MSTPSIAVIGPGDAAADPHLLDVAEAVGAGLATAGAAVVCGGLAGVMEAVARGAAGGGFGTLSEIGFALKLGRPVVGVATWELQHPDGTPDPIRRATDAAEAVRLALEAAATAGPPGAA